MKKLLLFPLFALSILPCALAQQHGWVKLNLDAIPDDPFFTDLYFTGDNTGWITTSSTNNIYRTDDGGATFSAQATSLGYTKAVHMLDANNGYSGGQSGWVYNTTTGGFNWNIVNSMGILLLDISFPPGTDPSNPTGYACGDNGQVWKITSTLTNLNTGLAGTFSGISAPSVNNVWFCGGNRIYYYNGTTFTSQSHPTGTFNHIHFINNSEGWVVGNAGIVARTTNGGASWIAQTNPDARNRSLYGVFFLNSNEGWAVGNQGLILSTANGGTTWTIAGDGLTTNDLARVHFTSSTNGYAVGAHKTLLKYTQLTSIEDETTQHVKFKLEQNYPNPFNESTTISWKIPEKSHIVLKVYDFTGREVKTLVDSEKTMGEHSVKFEAAGLPAGIYFYQIRANDIVETKKILTIK
jgi:hypothetical protein